MATIVERMKCAAFKKAHECSGLRRRTWLKFGACTAIGVILLLLIYAPIVPLPSSWCETGVYKAVGGRSSTEELTVYVVTPTYRRANQAPDMVRLSQALMLAEVRIFWVVVEDADRPSLLVRNIMHRSGLAGVQLTSRTPSQFRQAKHGKGVAPRLRAIAWLRANAVLPSVLYFADDDNSYDHRLFDQIARVQRVGVLPVGLIGTYSVSSPVVSPAGRVVGFHDSYKRGRRFAMDMAGFAVNMRLVLSGANVSMPYKLGQLETGFLESLGVSIDDMEPLAGNCTEVLVWHTKVVPKRFPSIKVLRLLNITSPNNLPLLYKNILEE
ncbi:galactosylgalactosylxylosylprotein 3-beta-glucuronosyltransferase S-like isoform X1 [Dermacentor andersoni]|uniref:galactosylgalactosylxylosylprotein 3-beta-glucuronosyltransferase S-like isoform X1 n=1 Tax=Dermacentor andersoni TaxID=34620 RepID=UPI003B3B351C